MYKLTKLFLFLITLCHIIGCGTTWVIRQDTYGGVIGYKGYDSGEKAANAIKKLVHCPQYTTQSDTLMQSAPRTAYMPVQTTNYSQGNVGGLNYSGSETQTQYVPLAVTDYWREYAYSCDNNPRNPAGNSSSANDCNHQCEELYQKGELKRGVSAEDCIKLTCK